MEKKIYEKPAMQLEEFIPNECVAACGDSGTIYIFNCTAPAGTLYYYPDSHNGVYTGDKTKTEQRWVPGGGGGHYEEVTVTTATRLGSYHPCTEHHEAPNTDNFYYGFVDYNNNGIEDSGEGVIVWRGINGNNGHAIVELDMNNWETKKS